MPHPAVGVDEPLLFDEPLDWQENRVGVHHADGDSRVTSERPVHRVLTQDRAVDGVVRVGGDAPDHVGGIDVLDVARHLPLEPLAEPRPDVAELGVAPRVRSRLLDVLLASTLRETDNRVALRGQKALDVLHHPVGSLHRKRNLGNEAHVHASRCQRRVHGNEAGLAAHELDHADAVERRLGLDRGRLDSLLRLLHGSVEPEGFVDVQNVIVDGFGDADDRNLKASFGALGADRVRPGVASVTADDKHHVDPLLLDGIDDLGDVAAAAAAANDGPASVLNPRCVSPSQRHVLHSVFPKPAPSEPDPGDFLHPVPNLQRVHHGSHHVVDSWAQTPAVDDGGVNLGRFKINLSPRARSVAKLGREGADVARLVEATVGRAVERALRGQGVGRPVGRTGQLARRHFYSPSLEKIFLQKKNQEKGTAGFSGGVRGLPERDRLQ